MDNASPDPSKGAGLLIDASGTGGKEVYEYTPDPGSLFIHDGSSQEGFDRGEVTSCTDFLRLCFDGEFMNDWEAYVYFRVRAFTHYCPVPSSSETQSK